MTDPSFSQILDPSRRECSGELAGSSALVEARDFGSKDVLPPVDVNGGEHSFLSPTLQSGW